MQGEEKIMANKSLGALGDELAVQIGAGTFSFGISGVYVGTVQLWRLSPEDGADDELVAAYTGKETLVGDCAEDGTTYIAKMDLYTSGTARVRISQRSV